MFSDSIRCRNKNMAKVVEDTQWVSIVMPGNVQTVSIEDSDDDDVEVLEERSATRMGSGRVYREEVENNKELRFHEVKAHESDELGGMSLEAYTNWSEVGSAREMVEALLNYVAALHMIRPWDFGGLVMLRVLHEVAFFGPSARTSKEQKELVKEFCEDVMQKNGRRAIAGDHPLT